MNTPFVLIHYMYKATIMDLNQMKNDPRSYDRNFYNWNLVWNYWIYILWLQWDVMLSSGMWRFNLNLSNNLK